MAKKSETADDLAPLQAGLANEAATVDAIRDLAEQARTIRASAIAEADAAEIAFSAGLVSATPQALQELKAQREAALLRDARAKALVVALDAKAAALDRATHEAARRDRYEAATRMRDEAAEHLRHQYPALVSGMRDLLRRLAEADAVVIAANAELPEGGELLAEAEALVRDRAALPREILSSEEVDLWCYEGSSQPVGDEFQNRVTPLDTKPHLGSDGSGARYRRQRFVRTVYLPEVPASPLPPLHATMVLPEMYGPDWIYAWKGTGWRSDPDTILQRLAEHEPASQPPSQTLGQKVETVLPDADAALRDAA